MSDLNILPEDPEQEEEGGSGSRLVPWLIVFAVGLLFVPLYFSSNILADTTAPLATQLNALETTLTAPPVVPDAEQTLTARLIDLRSKSNAIDGLPPTLVAGHTNWPDIMALLRSYDANQIRLTGFVNETTHLTLNGEAIQENSVLTYVARLQVAGYFSQVRVQTITLSGVPSPTPNLTPASNGSPTLTQVYMPFVFTLTMDLAGAG